MKKFLLASFTATCFFLTTQAQEPGLNFGVKVGANMNKIDGQSFKDGFTFGYQAGLFAELNFSKRIGIQPEVLWTESKTRTSDRFSGIYTGIGTNTISDVKLNYLTIPVLLNIRPANILTFQVGPQFGILVNKDESLLQNGKDAFKSGDFSMVGGGQLNLLKFRIYGRYAVGLSDINDIDDRDSWKNQAIQVGIGYAF